MTTDFRALCAELLSALESEGYAHWVNGPDEDDLCLRARAALADGPAVPDGREPAAVDTSLALRVQQLEAMRETEKAALLDAFQQIDRLKARIDWQYTKIHKLENVIADQLEADQ